jgi:hypothetical protein
MTLNILNVVLVFLTILPNKTVMGLVNFTHFLEERDEANLCHTAVLMKFL